jgi:hypothetical protein
MLLTIALFATIYDAPLNAQQVVQRGENRYGTQQFHQHTETVPDPNDPTKQVQATVSYSFEFEVRDIEAEEEDYEPFRTVRVRPESPARTFQMSEMRVGVEGAPRNQGQLRQLSEALKGENIPTSNAPVFRRAVNAMREIAASRVSPKPITVDPNLGIQSGGWTTREYGYEIYYTDLMISLKKHVTIPGRMGVTTTTVGEPAYMYMYEYWIPIPLEREKFTPDPVKDDRSSYHIPDGFGGLQFSDSYADLLGVRYVTTPRLELGYDMSSGKKTVTARQYRDDIVSRLPENRRNFYDLIDLTPNGVNDMLNSTAGQGTSMNSLQIPGDPDGLGMPRCGSEMMFPVGTAWIPDKPGYQTMTNINPVRINFAFEASLDGGLVTVQDVRMHCLNMALKEPAAGVRYFPYMSNDEVMEGLAKIAGDSRFRGPWDQVRTWIYTDKVGLTDANKRISPPVTEGQYANGLFDVFRLGGLNAKDLLNKKLFEPILLASPGTNEKAFSWLSMHMGEKFGADVRKYLEAEPEELQTMVTAPRSEFEKAQVPRMMTSLLTSVNKDARMGALSFLDKLRDGEKVLKDQVGDLSSSLYSDDAKEVELAKKVAARYVTPPDAELRALYAR